MLYETKPYTIRYFRDTMYHKTECLPIGQRLPVYSKNNEKGVGIITSLLSGISFGTITITKLNRKQRRAAAKIKYEFESIDGGHRKRSLWDYLNDGFQVDGKFFSELSEEKKNDFLDTKLTFDIYNELDAATKGHIFRTLNKTTDVNFMEMVNSYGDIPIANFVRETVRSVKQIDNVCNELFDYSWKANGDPNYRYLSFDNDRLKQDHAFARIVHRYITSPKELLGGSHDKEIEIMYEDAEVTEKVINTVQPKIKKHLDFLRKVGHYRKQQFKTGLTQHDFKALSYLYFYISDTYGSFAVPDAEQFFKVYARANSALMNKDGRYADIIHDLSGYTVQIMYKKYIGAPWDSKKISTAISYLVGEMDDIENIIETKDTNRSFTILEKEAKLAEQNFRCVIDNKKLKWNDAHAAHIVAHKNGGYTVYSNLAMVRACYNTEMGTMDLNVYKETLNA